MSNIKMIAITWLLILFCHTGNSFAESRSSISFELGTDNNSGQNYYLSGRYAFDNGMLLKAATGESTSTDNTNAKLKSNSYTAGIQSDPEKIVNLSFEISNANQINTVNIDSIILALDVNTLNWNVFFSPEFRNISVQTLTNNTINVSSTGLTTGLGYYGWDPFYISVQHNAFSYSKNLSAVGNKINIFTSILGSDTVDQIYALEDDRTTIELGYYFDNSSIAFSQSEGASTVDQSISTVDKIYFSFNLDNNWSLGMSVGTSSLNTSNSTTRFGNVSINYRW